MLATGGIEIWPKESEPREPKDKPNDTQDLELLHSSKTILDRGIIECFKSSEDTTATIIGRCRYAS